MPERAHPEDPAFRGTIYEERLRERYLFCQPFVQERDVLDVPCGVRWGSSLLSGYRSLVGLDIDPEAIAYARAHYSGIRLLEGSMERLPCEDASFDTVLCLEGLEHISFSRAQRFLSETHRVLRPHGTFIVTVPLLNNGRHSSNPYHMYEFTAAELQTLLAPYFATEQWEVIQGGDGPEVRFVGRRARQIGAETLPETITTPFDRAYQWVMSLAGERGFRFTNGGEESLIATCCAILILEGLDRLQDVPVATRAQWVTYLQTCQHPESGMFVDPLLERFPITSTLHDTAYVLDQMTYFALQALNALGDSALHPLPVVARWPDADAFVAWMAGLDWSNAWLQSNRIMFILSFLVDARERSNDIMAATFFHAALDWLDQAQDPQTGVWGTRNGSSLLNGMAAAYHFLPFYEYVCRPILHLHALIDSTLLLQQGDGMFGAGPGGGACEDLDAVGVLAVTARYTSYRNDNVQHAALRAFWAIWNTQNEDGGFGYAVRQDDQAYQFSSWPGMTSLVRASDVWAAWSRLIALGTLRHWFADDTPALPFWQFRRWPGLGYHRVTNTLHSDEQVRLKYWLRPLPSPEVPDGVEPRVSVIIPCFNLGRYLHEALDSVLRQTVQPVEVIVVDDGSTDEYTRFVTDALDHPQIRVIRQNNQGLPVARNVGIRAAKAAFICCLDADDRLRPTFFEQALQRLETDPCIGFVSSHYQEFDGRSGIVAYQQCALPDMLVTNQAMVSSVFRRSAWERVGGYCETMTGLHDWDFWISLLEIGYTAAVIPTILFEYRVRSNSMYATSGQPDNFARLVGQIVERHTDLYQHWWHDIIKLFAHEHAALALYAEGQARLARQFQISGDPGRQHVAHELRTWQHIAEERAHWITQLEEARDYHAQQATRWQAEALYQRSDAERWQAEALYQRGDAERWQAEALYQRGDAERWQAEVEYLRRIITEGETRHTDQLQQTAYWKDQAERWRAELVQLYREYIRIPRSRAALRHFVKRYKRNTHDNR